MSEHATPDLTTGGWTSVTSALQDCGRGVQDRYAAVPTGQPAAPSVPAMLAHVATFGLEGVDAREITVEVDVRPGLPAFTIVGLPDTAVREARERVRAALLNSLLAFPQSRITANLAPAWVRKAGPSFDLALAVCLLAASGQVPDARLDATGVCGELSLSGGLRPVRGALAVALAARQAGYRRLIVPVENADEAALAEGLEVLGLSSLERIVAVLHERETAAPAIARVEEDAPREGPDLADVRGQADARRALEIAAAGGHNLLMVGPPGAGKTMIARRMPGVLPPPSFDESLEITRIRSVAGLGGRFARTRPFRAPHHTISAQGLVGGGARPRPGEITLAHRGVLFLDELAEFSRGACEALRQPMEDGFVAIVRGQRALTFPAEAMLLAACNPCPCGGLPSECECAAFERARYHRRLSGPLLDRIDIVCQVSPPPALQLVGREGVGEPSARVRERVVAARERQLHRLAGSAALCNARMDGRMTRRHAALGSRALERLMDVVDAGRLTGRGHDRVLRLARTIADLEGREGVSSDDLDEALGYRLGGVGEAAA